MLSFFYINILYLFIYYYIYKLHYLGSSNHSRSSFKALQSAILQGSFSHDLCRWGVGGGGGGVGGWITYEYLPDMKIVAEESSSGICLCADSAFAIHPKVYCILLHYSSRCIIDTTEGDCSHLWNPSEAGKCVSQSISTASQRPNSWT